MRVRLSKSKIGWAVCRQPIRPSVGLRSLGGATCVRSHSSDLEVLDELLISHDYDPLLELLPESPRTIVDLGANVGLVGRWMLTRYPKARLVAVEPQPENVEVLRENLARFANATVVPTAIGATEREVTLHAAIAGHYARFTMVGEPPKDAVSHQVPVITMQQLFAETGLDQIDVLKVDIEGAERELFSDCSSWIHAVGTILVECHFDFTATDLVGVLEENGAKFEVLRRDVTPAEHLEVAVLRRTA